MARANAFVDYSETDKPGLYQFKDGSGGSRLLYGTAAEEIKTGIDKGRASVAGALGAGKMSADEWNAMALAKEQKPLPASGPDERTAALTPGGTSAGAASAPVLTPGGTRSDAPAAPVRTPGGIGASPSGATGTPVPKLTPEQDAKYRTLAKKQAETGKSGESAPEAGPAGADFELVSADKNFEYYIRAGTDGSRPGDRMKVAKARAGSAGRPGGWRDMSMQVQGGHPVNEDLLGQMQMTSGVREVAIEENLATAEEENRLVQQEIARQADLQAKIVEEERKRQDDVQRFTDNAKTELEKYTAQVNNAQINPDRIYSGEGGAARERRHRIASIFGAFGSTLAKTPNFVAERLARMKEDDIHAQEKDLLKLEGQRDTALKYFRDLTGDLDTAKSAVRALQSQQNILALKKIEAMAKTPRDRTAAKVAIAAEQEALQKEFDAYLRSAAGTRTVASQNLMPVAGTAARPRGAPEPLTFEEAKNLKELGKGGKAEGEVGKDIAKQWGDSQSMSQLASKYPADYVPPTKENSAIPSRVAGSLVDWGLGSGTWNRAFKSPAERQAMQDYGILKYNLTAALAVSGGQGAVNDAERPAIEAGQAPGATFGELSRAWEIQRSRLEQQARAQGISVDQLMNQFRNSGEGQSAAKTLASELGFVQQ